MPGETSRLDDNGWFFTQGNLSVQLTRLEEAGLILISKAIVKKRTLTTALLTEGGGSALKAYWANMEMMRELAKVRAEGGKGTAAALGRELATSS